MMILSDYGEYYELKKMRENNYLPSMIFFLQKIPIHLFLGRIFLIVNRFSKCLQHILGQTKRRILHFSTIKLKREM